MVAADDAARLLAAPPAPVKLYRVGTVTDVVRSAAAQSRRPGEDRSSPRASIISARSKIRHGRETNGQHADMFDLDSEDETERLGRVIADLVEPGVVIGLVGPLGAGKTRLARAIAEALGVDPAAISSPTFVLIHEYEGRLPIYHFDAYRLQESASL